MKWQWPKFRRDEFFLSFNIDGNRFEARGSYARVMKARKIWEEMLWEDAVTPKRPSQQVSPAPQTAQKNYGPKQFNAPRLKV